MGNAIDQAFSLLKVEWFSPFPTVGGPSQEQMDAQSREWAAGEDNYNWAKDEQDSDLGVDESEDPCCTEAKEAYIKYLENKTGRSPPEFEGIGVRKASCEDLAMWIEQGISDELEHNEGNHWTGNLESLRAIQDQWNACASESFSDMKYAGEPIDIAYRLLKAQMSDIHIGFQEDPEKEIERLRHMGISREEAMHMYQQYVDSLGHGA